MFHRPCQLVPAPALPRRHWRAKSIGGILSARCINPPAPGCFRSTTTMIDYDPERPAQTPGDSELARLQKELSEAHKTIRSLLRQISKEQARHAETARAYNLTVANLV